MEIVDVVAFKHMDHRLANILFERYQVKNPILITHQEILTSREVISRLLEDFAKREIIQLSHVEIIVVDFEELKTYLI